MKTVYILYIRQLQHITVLDNRAYLAVNKDKGTGRPDISIFDKMKKLPSR